MVETVTVAMENAMRARYRLASPRNSRNSVPNERVRFALFSPCQVTVSFSRFALARRSSNFRR